MRGSIVLVVAILTFVACTPSAPTPTPAAPAGQPAGAPAAPKIVKIGVIVEPKNFLEPGGGRNEEQILDIADAGLVKKNDKNEQFPLLATEIPALERGTWTVAPDGTMEITWRLRRDATWHDGQPLTSDDLLFGWDYLVHPQTMMRRQLWAGLVERVAAPDPWTFIISYRSTYALANQEYLRPLPRHILGSAFAAGDLERIGNSAYWREEFIGLGPFRLTKWEAGSHMEFTRFDAFVLGPPRLDRVIYAFYPDPNTLIANILASEVDVHLPTGLGAQQALDLRQRWAGTGHQVMTGSNGFHRLMAPQLRPEYANPSYLLDRRVRQALYRAFDREAYNEALHLGLGMPADSWIPPDDPRRQVPAFRDSIVQYPYDVGQAQRELEALGWRRGADGMLVNAAGERFEYEIVVNPDAFVNAQAGVLVDIYKKVGVSIIPTVFSAAQIGDIEYRSKTPAWQSTARTLAGAGRLVPNWEIDELYSGNIPVPPRWAGANRGGYASPEVDALYDRLAVTLPLDQRNQLVAQLLRAVTTELPVLFALWDVSVMTATARVRGVSPPNPSTSHAGIAWNIYEWDVVGP